MIGSIKIDVGANLKGLRIGMDESLSLLDQWQGKAAPKVSGLWDQFTEGLSSGPMDIIDQVGNTMGGLGSVFEAVSVPIGKFDSEIGNSIKGLSSLTSEASHVTTGIANIGIGLTPLIRMFPMLGQAGAAAMTMITGPIGWTVAGLAALGTLLYKNMGMAINMTKDLTNRYVDLYNKSEPVRLISETIAVAWNLGYNNAKAFFDYVALGFKTLAAGSMVIKSGNFSLLGNIFDMAGAEGEKIGLQYVDGIVKTFAESEERMQKGLEHVTSQDIANTTFFKGLKTVGDSISSLFASDDTFEPINVDFGKIEGEMGKIQTPLERLKAKIQELDAYMQNQFLQNDIEGARLTMTELVDLEDQLKLVQKSAELLSRTQIVAPEIIAPLDRIAPLDLMINRPAEISKRIEEIEIQLKNNPQNLDTIKALEDELKSLRDEAEKITPTMDHVATSMERAAVKIKDVWKDIGRNMETAIGDALASGITHLFDGPDKERLAGLNAEIERNQELLRDKSASKEQREAAKARLQVLEEEEAAERARGNVIVQTTATIIDAARKQIQSAIAVAIGNAIKGESSKGLLGLVTAGIAVAGFSALFASKVPRLARGGVLDEPTFVQVGEYPGAQTNKEIVTPQNLMKEVFTEVIQEQYNTTNQNNVSSQNLMKEVFTEVNQGHAYNTTNQNNVSTQMTVLPAPPVQVVLNGELMTRIEGDAIMAVVKIAHNNEKRATGRNPFAE